MHDFSHYRTILAAQDWQHGEQTLAPHVADWLLYTDSLTQKLQQERPLTVEIVSQGWQTVKNHENSPGCWLREVLLKGGTQDWIFAQTLVPQATIDNVAQAIPELGEQPIGLWLFPQQPQRLSLAWRQDRRTGLYARCSTLLLNGYPLEIKELFLAQFPFTHENVWNRQFWFTIPVWAA